MLQVMRMLPLWQPARNARNQPVAVRSSAREEDGAAHSFAGQFDSFLDVSPHDIAQNVARVWRSAASARVREYRRAQGLIAPLQAPCVLVQRMTNAQAAGVAFSRDVVNGRDDVAVVSAVHGLGDALVSGERDADTWHIEHDGVIASRRLTEELPVLRDEQVRSVANLARNCADFFGCAQDIEWAIENERLWLLQSRPITSSALNTARDDECVLWITATSRKVIRGLPSPSPSRSRAALMKKFIASFAD